MTPQSDLEIKGNFSSHPFAELVAEISQARLNGSLLMSYKDRKCVIYLKEGRVVFAVSNARTLRLFDILLKRNRLTKDDLAQAPNFANDFEFASFLEEKKFLTKPECDSLFAEQIEAIIIDILAWPEGDWSFSSLKRIRDGIDYDIHTKRLLFDYGRCMPVDVVLTRFRTMDEKFQIAADFDTTLNMTPDEAFVLSRMTEMPLTVADLSSVAAMSESKALHVIYTLWLGGFIVRDYWQHAFSDATIVAMRGAKLEIKREASLIEIPATGPEIIEALAAPEPAIEITLDEYLERVEQAETHYELLGVNSNADKAEIKSAYFAFAKMFHPDKYHSEGGDILQRIQSAFTDMAQAHETLKNPEKREIYDYRMRKEIAEREKRAAAGNTGNAGVQIEQATLNFDRGFQLLMDNESELALPFLARAVHFAPKNASYHAYLGKALSVDEKQRHKAESEMQTAVKLDPGNPTFRILLAEFFIQMNLLKRATGELKRLLDIFPSNLEARDLLASLQK